MAQHTGVGLKVSLSGKAAVFCVHDRQKRQVVTDEQVFDLAKDVGFKIMPGVHHVFECSCCENLFVDSGTEPRYCVPCRGKPVHAPTGPLPEPKGVVD